MMMTLSYTKAVAEDQLSNFKFNILTAPGFLVSPPKAVFYGRQRSVVIY